LKLYSSNKTNFDILQVEYNAYLDKAKLVDKNRERLQSLINEKNSLITEVSELKSKLDEYNKTLSELESSISIQEQYYDKYIQFCDIESQYKDIQKRIDDYTAKSNKALLSLNDIERYKADIDNLNRELDPVNNQINTLSGQLTLLESYYEEYNRYKSSYDMIETIKKYCSPTGGGIQTIFMQLYMSKTLELSNQVLSMLFGGEYQLLNFIINENEFRIPFIGNGLPVDDISSGSDSQKAIMGMIINLVLLHQASTKFNIARLDEIDGTLDIRNKAEFVNALYHSIDILEIDQLFLISHSIETDNTNADIIKFKFYNDYESGIESGNVIYDYNQIIG
jgi:DNA repair exonuclease SbcCD ATPase subunit